MKPVHCILLLPLLFPRFVTAQDGQQSPPPLHITAYIELDDDVTPKPLTADVISCYDRLDELVLAFFNPNKRNKGNLVAPAPEFVKGVDAIIARAHDTAAHHRVKVLLSIGGDKAKHTAYLADLVSPANRDGFIRQINTYVLDHQFDGVDIDFEDKALVNANYGPFLTALNGVLKADSPKRELTVAVEQDLFREQHMTSEALISADFVNAMSYDQFDKSFAGQRASYSFAEEDISYWLDSLRVPARKLNLGLPFYGYLKKNNRQSQQVPFFKIEATPGADPDSDTFQTGDGQTLLYNGRKTIGDKTVLAKKKGINGLMIWEITYDRNLTLLDMITDKL